MPAWIPLIKVVLPYVAPFFAATLPAFTKKKSERADPVVNQQISELQGAVKTNAESIAAIAKTLTEANEAMQQSRLLVFVAIGIAVFSLAVAVAAWLR